MNPNAASEGRTPWARSSSGSSAVSLLRCFSRSCGSQRRGQSPVLVTGSRASIASVAVTGAAVVGAAVPSSPIRRLGSHHRVFIDPSEVNQFVLGGDVHTLVTRTAEVDRCCRSSAQPRVSGEEAQGTGAAGNRAGCKRHPRCEEPHRLQLQSSAGRGDVMMCTMRLLLAVTAVCLLAGAAGCGASTGGLGDCNSRIAYQGGTYRPHNQLRPWAPTEPVSVGSGDVVGCNGEAVDHVAVYAISGVAPNVAIAVTDSRWEGLYVLTGTNPSDWPSEIKVAGN